jgi:hypothetical protein
MISSNTTSARHQRALAALVVERAREGEVSINLMSDGDGSREHLTLMIPLPTHRDWSRIPFRAPAARQSCRHPLATPLPGVIETTPAAAGRSAVNQHCVAEVHTLTKHLATNA